MWMENGLVYGDQKGNQEGVQEGNKEGGGFGSQIEPLSGKLRT